MATVNSLDWLQTLADGTRVRLLRLLDAEELSVSELCTVLQLPQSTVSRHLKVLAADDWVASRRDGTNHLYRMQRENWSEPRRELWIWVESQSDSPTTKQDQERLRQVLSQRSRSQEFFSSTAEQWDRLRVELFGKRIDAFALAAAMESNRIVAELGCGSAPLSQLIAPYVKRVYAIDGSDAMLAAAKQRLEPSAGREPGASANVELVHAELTKTSLPDCSVDIAWMVLVLPYIDDPSDIFREAKRILKPDARLIVVDLQPHERTTYRQEMGHLHLGTEKAKLNEWLDASGLRLRRYDALPPDTEVKGPGLFAAVAS
ncbi:MAG: ArsR/SmtB family transcription factor [Aureliella sp.]